MKPDDKLLDPNAHVEIVELTPQLKDRLCKVSAEMIDELVKRTLTPQEAYMVLQFMIDALQEHYGFTGSRFEGVSDEAES